MVRTRVVRRPGGIADPATRGAGRATFPGGPPSCRYPVSPGRGARASRLRGVTDRVPDRADLTGGGDGR